MTIQRPALGRLVKLGGLYDCRSDQLIPGEILESLDLLNITTAEELRSDFECFCGDSFEEKSRSIGLSGELTLSEIAGYFGVGGSLQYVQDRVSSTRQVRLALHYSCTTRTEHLSLSDKHIKKLSASNGQATHVIVAITYGADAHFVFDALATSLDEKKTISTALNAKLSAAVASLKTKKELTWKPGQKQTDTDFKSRFFGDFIPTSNPATIEEAVKLYATLPALLGVEGNYKSVPKQIQLQPLKTDAVLVEIDLSLVGAAVKIREALLDQKLLAVDLLQEYPAAAKISAYKQKIQKFVECLDQCHSLFRLELVALLPQIRSGREKQEKLARWLEKHEKSPFNTNAVSKWLEWLAKDMKMLDSNLSDLKSFPPIKRETVSVTKHVKSIVCLTLIVNADDDYLSQLKSANKSRRKSNDGQGLDVLTDFLGNGIKRNVSCPLWSDQRTAWDHANLEDKVKIFKDFAEINAALTSTQFTVIDASDSQPLLPNLTANDVCIELYTDRGFEPFEPPSKPLKFTAEAVSPTTALLTWQPPNSGRKSLVRYEIIHRAVSDSLANVTDVDANRQSCSLTDLKAGMTYSFIVRAISKCGSSMGVKLDYDQHFRLETQWIKSGFLATQLSSTVQELSKIMLVEPVTNVKSDPPAYNSLSSMEQKNESSEAYNYSPKLAAVYVIGISKVTPEREKFLKLPVSTKQWQELNPLPAPRQECGGCSVNRALFLIGGKKHDSLTHDIDIYDCARMTWTIAPVRLQTPRRSPAVVAIDDNIYIIGGSDQNKHALQSVEVYNITQQSIKFVASMHAPKSCPAAVKLSDTELFILHGQCVEKYDCRRDKWTICAGTTKLYNCMSATLAGKEVFIADKWSVDGYNIDTGHCREVKNLEGSFREYLSAVGDHANKVLSREKIGFTEHLKLVSSNATSFWGEGRKLANNPHPACAALCVLENTTSFFGGCSVKTIDNRSGEWLTELVLGWPESLGRMREKVCIGVGL